MSMRQAEIEPRSPPGDWTSIAAQASEPALGIVVVYQDAVTRHWASGLLDRLGQLIDAGCIRPKYWKLGNLTGANIFAEAVHAAAKADVLVIAVRDAGELPPLLHVWIDAWMPLREGRTGTLVALIGVPARPNALSGRAHWYLESVARQAGLDFIPRERKLPERPDVRDESLSVIAATR